MHFLILVIEILSNKIKYDKSLNGVVASVGQEKFEYKSFQCADDVSLFLPGNSKTTQSI